MKNQQQPGHGDHQRKVDEQKTTVRCENVNGCLVVQLVVPTENMLQDPYIEIHCYISWMFCYTGNIRIICLIHLGHNHQKLLRRKCTLHLFPYHSAQMYHTQLSTKYIWLFSFHDKSVSLVESLWVPKTITNSNSSIPQLQQSYPRLNRKHPLESLLSNSYITIHLSSTVLTSVQTHSMFELDADFFSRMYMWLCKKLFLTILLCSYTEGAFSSTKYSCIGLYAYRVT